MMASGEKAPCTGSGIYVAFQHPSNIFRPTVSVRDEFTGFVLSYLCQHLTLLGDISVDERLEAR